MTVRTSSFPSTEQFAHAFYGEAARHLEDARILQEASRTAAAITSAMKASELGVKTVLLLDNAAGYYEKVYATHKPLTEIANHIILKRIPAEIDKGRKGLAFDIGQLEQLEPKKPGTEKFGVAEANTEYPFLMMAGDATVKYAVLNTPTAYFPPADALKYYRLGHELLTVLAAIYPVIAAWSITLPPIL